MENNVKNNVKGLDHSWRYFELHAGQRMALFNFFLVLSGLVAAGLATSLQSGSDSSVFRCVLGGLLAVISAIFWKLDQRVSFLVKYSEDAIAALETDSLPEASRLFGGEERRFNTSNLGRPYLCKVWTYGSCFRWVFAIMAAFGIGVIVFTLCQATRAVP